MPNNNQVKTQTVLTYEQDHKSNPPVEHDNFETAARYGRELTSRVRGEVVLIQNGRTIDRVRDGELVLG